MARVRKTIIKPTRRHGNAGTLPKRKPTSSLLPIEVCERIIDFVAELWNLEGLRSRTLRACALTCRAWTPRSVYHIVSKYDNIRTEGDFSRYVSLLQKYPLFAHYVTEVSTLTSLEVWEGFGKTLDKDVSQSLRSFVLACGNLRHLLVCSTTPDYPEIESLDLRSNLLLESLELIFEEYNEKVSGHIVTVLSEASTSHLNKLTLRFNLLDDPDDDVFRGCDVMDDVLSVPRFRSLKDFVIDFDVKPEVSFPKLWAKRVRVGVVDSESTKTLFKRRHMK